MHGRRSWRRRAPPVRFARYGSRAASSDVLRFHQHAAAHFHVHGVAEPGAEVPIDAGLVGDERHRGGLLWADLHVDAVVDDAEAVGQVLDVVDVGFVDGHLVALLDLELLERKGGRAGIHVDPYFVAVADDLAIALQLDAVGGGLLSGVLEERVVALPDAHHFAVQFGAMDDHGIMGFGEARAVVDDFHLVTGNIDELIVLWLQGADIEEAVLGELVQREQPFAVRLLGFTHRGMIVAGLVMHVDLLDDGIHLLTFECSLGEIDVPLADLAVEEERRVSVPPVVEPRVQRTQTELRFGDDDVARLDLVIKQLIKQAHIHDRHRRRELAVGHYMDAVWRSVHAVRAVRHRNVARVGRAVPAVDDGHAVDFLEVAFLHCFFDTLDVEDGDPVLFARGHFGERHALLRIVAGRERIFALVVGVGIVEIAVDHHLPGNFHGVAVDGGEDRPVLLRVVQHLAVIGDRDFVFAVAEQISGARIFLWSHAVDRVLIGNFDDLVALHDVGADTGQARVRLVIDENIAPVIGAVGERHMRVMAVAVLPSPIQVSLEAFAGLGRQPFGQYFQRLVGLSPSGGAAPVEHGNAHQLAHRRHADDANFAGLAAGEEDVVFVELAWRDLDLLGAGPCGRPGLGRRWRRLTGLAKTESSSDACRTKCGRADNLSSSRAMLASSYEGGSMIGSADFAGTRTGLPAWVMTVLGPLLPGRMDGDDIAANFSRLSRT